MGASASPPEMEPPEAESTPAQTRSKIEVLLLAGDVNLETPAWRTRLPGVRVLLLGSGAFDPDAGRYAFVDVQRGDAETTLELVTPDGYAYLRKLDADIGDGPLVSSLANLVAAVGEGALAPTRVGVALPPLEDKAKPEPVDERPTPPEPKEIEEAPPESSGEDPTESEGLPGTALEQEVRGLALSAAARGQAVLGLTPAAGPRLFGGALALELEWPGGALIGVSASAGANGSVQLQIVRAQFSIDAGYRIDTGSRFEVLLRGSVGLEPWWARSDGKLVAFESAAAPANRLLWSAGLGAEPRVLLSRSRSGLEWLVALNLDLRGVGAAGSVGSLRIADPAGPVRTLGGVEFTGGLGLVLRSAL